MVVITCPYCHELRHEDELLCGDEVDVVRPTDPQTATDMQWCNYLYMRTDALRNVRERWCCVVGCGQWFEVERDSVTGRIHNVGKLRTLAAGPTGEDNGAVR